MKDGSRMVFTEIQVGDNVVHGRLSYVYGRRGYNYLHFQYDGSGKLTTILSSTGIDLGVEYHANGYLSRIYQYEDTSHEVTYSYVTSEYHDGLLDRVEYAQTDFYDYDQYGVLQSYSNTRKRLAYDYDAQSTGDLKYNIEAIYDGRGNTASLRSYAMLELEYDTSDRITTYREDPGFDASNAWRETELL